MALTEAIANAFSADSTHSKRTSSCYTKANAKSDKESFSGFTTINKSIRISSSNLALGLHQAKHMLKITEKILLLRTYHCPSAFGLSDNGSFPSK